MQQTVGQPALQGANDGRRRDLGIAQHLRATLAKPEFADYAVAGPGFVGGMFGLGTGAGMRKEDAALKDMFNTAIDAAIADGTIKRLSEKWVHTDVTPVK